MEALCKNMKLPGMEAYRFAATMGVFDEHDEWADDFGSFIAAIRDEDKALKLALSQECEAQTHTWASTAKLLRGPSSSTGGEKVSKLTLARKSVLQACTLSSPQYLHRW